MTDGTNIGHKKGTTTMRPFLGSETKNYQKSQFTPGIRDIHKCFFYEARESSLVPTSQTDF